MIRTVIANIPVLLYNPRAEGLRRWFGPTEALVMDVLWHAKRPLDVKGVLAIMAHDEGETRNYRTIATTLTRLTRSPKPLLRRRSVPSALRGGHDSWLYWPICTLADFEARQASAITESLGVLA